VNKKSRPYGYTLLEVLIVLLVVSAFALLPLLSLRGWQKQMAVSLFFASFERQLLQVQQAAIVEGHESWVVPHPNKQAIYFSYRSRGATRFVMQPVPEGIRLDSDTAFRFNNISGSANKLTQINFIVADQKVTYQLQVGSGKVEKYVSKK